MKRDLDELEDMAGKTSMLVGLAQFVHMAVQC